MKKSIKTKINHYISIFGVGQSYSPSYSDEEETVEYLLSKKEEWLKSQRHLKKNARGPYPFNDITEGAIELLLSSTGRNKCTDIKIITKTKKEVIFSYNYTGEYDISRTSVELWKYKIYS